MGKMIMAHYWFHRLLELDGGEIPSWSKEEMDGALAGESATSTRTDVPNETAEQVPL